MSQFRMYERARRDYSCRDQLNVRYKRYQILSAALQLPRDQ